MHWISVHHYPGPEFSVDPGERLEPIDKKISIPLLAHVAAAAAAAAPSDNNAKLSSDQLQVELWKTEYGQLEEHCKVVSEQKN